MKITIDTKEDSHEEIKKVIDILHSMVGASNAAQESGPQPVVGEGIFGMFSAENKEEPSEGVAMPTSEEVSGMFSENREENVKLPDTKVINGVTRETDDDDTRVVTY